MKRFRSVLLAPILAAFVLTGCGVVVPDIDVASWFGYDGTIAAETNDAAEWARSSSAIDRGSVAALGRGGITLSGLSIAGGSATDTSLAASRSASRLAPAQVATIDTAIITLFVSSTSEGLSASPLRLGTLVVPVTGADGDWTLDAAGAEFTLGSSEAIAVLNDATTFYSRVTVAFREGEAVVTAQYDFAIDDLTAAIEATP